MLVAIQYFVRRVSTRDDISDEDRAMSTQTWGPFATEERAAEGLVKALREEAKDLLALGKGAHNYIEFYAARAAKFEQAAYMVELHGLLWTRVEGISYSIREVKKNAIGNVVK